jgi:hypothetical protein
MFRRIPVLIAVLITALIVFVPVAGAQSGAPLHVVQGSDGTLYVVDGQFVMTVVPELISDDDLASLIDVGNVGSHLPPPPPPPAPQIVVVTATPTQAPAEPPATATPVPAVAIPLPVIAPEQAITMSGNKAQNTSLFTLRGGNYAVNWNANASDQYGGAFSIFLHPSDPSNFHETLIANEVIKTSSSGQNNAYNMTGGQYYFQVGGSCCRWSVTISPQ